MNESVNTPKRKRGRPPKNQTRAASEARPRERIPVSGHRDILTVLGKDPDFAYRWVGDVSEDGQRIYRFKMAGYDFAPADELKIGTHMVYKTENIGSIIRTPAGGRGSGGFLYLMRILQEFADEDAAKKAALIDDTESNGNAADELEGQYGQGKTEHSIKKESLEDYT